MICCRHDLKRHLARFYVQKKLSMQEIASRLSCSVNKVCYWMIKHNIQARSMSEAVYAKHNPPGDPFSFKQPTNLKEAELLGFGLGLYWGEGTKADRNT